MELKQQITLQLDASELVRLKGILEDWKLFSNELAMIYDKMEENKIVHDQLNLEVGEYSGKSLIVKNLLKAMEC